MTKHQQLLEHIENLPVGAKISVRQIAKELMSVRALHTGPSNRRKIGGW